MRDVVRAAFVRFTVPLEGVVSFLYPDVKNLVSIGIGNLVDPIQLAMNLPLVHDDGSPASRAEIAAEWLRIKNLPNDDKGRTAAQLGHRYAMKFATLHLTEEGIDQVVGGKLNQNDQILARAFENYEAWPADAQLAALSLAWAVGPSFYSPAAGKCYFPKLTSALHSMDFMTAAVECFMPEEATISGLRPRNIANRILFRNAALGLDPAILYYPRDLTAAPVDPDADTQPELPNPASEPTICPPPFDLVHKLPGDEPPDEPA